MSKVKYLVLAFFICMGIFCLWWSGIFSGSKMRTHSRSVTLMERLKNLDQLEVLQSEFIAHKTYESNSYMGLNQTSFLLYAKGVAQYGVSLSEVRFKEGENHIKVAVPPVKLLRSYIQAGSLNTLGINKGWFTSQVQFEQLKSKSLHELEHNIQVQARSGEYMKAAEKRAKVTLAQFLKMSGVQKEIRFVPYASLKGLTDSSGKVQKNNSNTFRD